LTERMGRRSGRGRKARELLGSWNSSQVARESASNTPPGFWHHMSGKMCPGKKTEMGGLAQ
jgi:hypothetical protein